MLAFSIAKYAMFNEIKKLQIVKVHVYFQQNSIQNWAIIMIYDKGLLWASLMLAE